MDLITHCVFIAFGITLLCLSFHDCKFRNEINFKNVGDNSDIYLDSFDLLSKYGYKPQRHRVTTEDGYDLTIFRIPRNGPPVLLVHGIADSSDAWLVLGPDKSLAYLLADNQFDVWLFNARGNKYSKKYQKYVPDEEYWNFSYEEMGTKDLPATIDYILSVTSKVSLSYVGFSQGSTIFFVMCSERPEYTNKINHAFLLAPVAWVTNLHLPYIDVLVPTLEKWTEILDQSRVYEVFPDNLLTNLYHASVCNVSGPAKILCDLEYYLNYGLRNTNLLPKDRLPVIASHIPAGTSTKTFLHFIQGYASKKFQRYDYFSKKKNEKVYGREKPPEYDVRLVRTPVSLFISESDWFTDVADVRILMKNLPHVANVTVFKRAEDFSHIEFVYGIRAKTFVNKPVLSLLKFYNKH